MSELINVLDDIKAEVLRQLELWGTEFDDMNTANDWCAYICRYASDGAYDGGKGQYTPERYEKYLKKVAAICVSAILTIKRNGDCAPRHYEGQVGAGSKEPVEIGKEQ